MNFVKLLYSFYKENTYEIWITIIVFSNIFQQIVPAQVYFVGLLMFWLKYRQYQPKMNSAQGLYVAFILLLWFSSVIGFTLDLRLVVFTMVLIVTAPTNSFEWYSYKLKLLRCFYWGFAAVTVLNFYAKLIGYNYLDIFRDEYSINKTFEFSGFGRFAMWTSCAAAISTMVFASYAFRKKSNSLLYNIVCYAMMLVSLYIVTISASRSAFILAIACSLLVVKMQTNGGGKLLRNLIAIGFTVVLFAPVFENNSEAIMRKKNGFQLTTKNTSRDELWSQRIAEFQSSPIWGIGFAAHGIGKNKVIGRNESGGSYISILAQTGLLGILLVAFIWFSAIMLPGNVPRDPNIVLTYCAFVFVSLHCTIEGYMFQAGWYLCFVTWLIVGVMIETKTFGYQLDENDSEEAEY